MNLLQTIESTGVVLKKVSTTKGGEYAGPCPHCGGNDRFRCWPDSKGGEGSFWCRQCGKWGDFVQFLVDFKNYSYTDAFMAAGRDKPEYYPPIYQYPSFQLIKKHQKKYEPREFETPCISWKEKALKFVKNAHKVLLKKDDVLDYLSARGLDLMSVKAFQLGWFPGEQGKGCLYRPRSSWGLPPIKNENGREKMLWIPRGLVIPCFKNGDIYRIRIRRPENDIKSPRDIKYYVVPGSGMEAMGLNPDSKAFVIVESELDGFLIARKARSLVGVVALGSAQAKPGAGNFPYLKKALKVLVALDWDTAGKNAWPWWKENLNNSRFWPVPEGKDPGEAYKSGVDIKQWILAGLPPVFSLNTYDNDSLPDNLVPPENFYPLQELKFFLKRLPIEIIADQERNDIVFSPGLNNQQIIDRVRKLFFEDEEVFYYLKLIHPESVIHGGNIDFKLA